MSYDKETMCTICHTRHDVYPCPNAGNNFTEETRMSDGMNDLGRNGLFGKGIFDVSDFALGKEKIAATTEFVPMTTNPLKYRIEDIPECMMISLRTGQRARFEEPVEIEVPFTCVNVGFFIDGEEYSAVHAKEWKIGKTVEFTGPTSTGINYHVTFRVRPALPEVKA